MANHTRTLAMNNALVKRLAEHDPQPPQQIIDDAKATVQQAREHLAYSAAVVESMIIEKTCTGRFVYTSSVPTMAVAVAPDGTIVWAVNPYFVLDIGPGGTEFVLCHEACHLLRLHLYSDAALNEDKRWEVACELTINYWVAATLQRDLPKKVSSDEETGVNPKTIYADYKRDLTKHGLEAVSFDDFVCTDIGAFAQLCRMSRPPKTKTQTCVHSTDPGTGGKGSPGSGSPAADGDWIELDPEAVSESVDEVLSSAVAAAAGDNGNQQIRKELLKLAERSEGSERATTLWGNVGLGILRGDPVVTREVRYWEQWTRNQLADRLEEGSKLRLLRKAAHLFDDPPMRFRGDEYVKHVSIYIDTSGSMFEAVLDFLRRQVGTEEGLRVEYYNFDCSVVPVTDGEAFAGGGGTSFQCISDHVDEMEEPPDAIVVVTDGYAPEISPADPDRWIWLIVDTPTGTAGNDWPERHRPEMSCHRVTAEDMELR